MRKEQLCVYLYKNCRGKKKCASAKAIRSDLHMSENELRKHVNRLRRECIPIGSSSNGYYFAETAAEVYDTIKNLRRIRDGIDAAITGLECSMISFRAVTAPEKLHPVGRRQGQAPVDHRTPCPG